MNHAACSECHGTGEILYAPAGNYNPELVDYARCWECDGSGWVEAYDEAPAFEWEYEDLEHLLNDADTDPHYYQWGSIATHQPQPVILAVAA
jgi:hypothetical protein